jgi:hypothetical protein
MHDAGELDDGNVGPRRGGYGGGGEGQGGEAPLDPYRHAEV